MTGSQIPINQVIVGHAPNDEFYLGMREMPDYLADYLLHACGDLSCSTSHTFWMIAFTMLLLG